LALTLAGSAREEQGHHQPEFCEVQTQDDFHIFGLLIAIARSTG
jgi:hypothetical protein